MRKSVAVGRHTESKNLDGLSEVLSGMKTLSECVRVCQVPNLFLLFAGHYPPNPSELLGKKIFSQLIADSREFYDYVIVDTPPLGRVIDAAVIAPNCDGVAVVIGSQKTTSREAQAMVDQLRKSGCTVLGAIRNCVSTKSSRYYKYNKYQQY